MAACHLQDKRYAIACMHVLVKQLASTTCVLGCGQQALQLVHCTMGFDHGAADALLLQWVCSNALLILMRVKHHKRMFKPSAQALQGLHACPCGCAAASPQALDVLSKQQQ